MSYFGPSLPSSIVTTGLKELTGLLEEANFITLLKTLHFNKYGFPLGPWVSGARSFKKERKKKLRKWCNKGLIIREESLSTDRSLEGRRGL